MRLDVITAAGAIAITLSERNLLGLTHKLVFPGSHRTLATQNAYRDMRPISDLSLVVRVDPDIALDEVVVTDDLVAVTLAPASLDALLIRLRRGEAGSLVYRDVDGWELIVRGQSDAHHYADRPHPPGRMHPATEEFLHAASADQATDTGSGEDSPAFPRVAMRMTSAQAEAVDGILADRSHPDRLEVMDQVYVRQQLVEQAPTPGSRDVIRFERRADKIILLARYGGIAAALSWIDEPEAELDRVLARAQQADPAAPKAGEGEA